MPALQLEDFATRTESGAMSPRAEVDGGEAERQAAYEQGYRAGWDDAVRAESEDQSRIGPEFARTLLDLGFTFHDARQQVLRTLEPLLTQMVKTVLPGLSDVALAEIIRAELTPLAEEATDLPLELSLAPASRPIVEERLGSDLPQGVRLAEEPSLAPTQAVLRVGAGERKIDLGQALDGMAAALDTYFHDTDGKFEDDRRSA